MVREIERAAPPNSTVHFYGKCGELPTVAELQRVFDRLLNGQPLARDGWEMEAW
jgi:2-oxoglutarate ferredoxin oxidoreductase subunit alpha